MNKNVPKLFSAELDGINAELVEVEADINVGLHSFSIVGLADKAVSEAKERVNSALKNCGIKPPTKENRRITINLAPADVKKAGSRFDLPIAVAYLLASEQIRAFETKNKIFIGELSLDGKLRPVNGALSIALLAKEKGLTEIYLPEKNAEETAVIHGINTFPLKDLTELIKHLEATSLIKPTPETIIDPGYPETAVALSEIKGQESAKRALLVAASGGHHIMMSGPPGTGKTMLAEAFASILPPPTSEECVEITRIWSAAGLNTEGIINHRPFRSPHHSASPTSLLGGGSNPRPGEISLAHRGILFLDETPEFQRSVIEGLRQPLESGKIIVARAKKSLTFPARFTLVLAKNPCPCGYFDDSVRECKCTANEVNRYQKKISGPLMDRIDIQLEVERISIEKLRKQRRDEGEDERCRALVEQARQIQRKRFADVRGVHSNTEMTSRQTEEFAKLTSAAERFIEKTLNKNLISPRGYYRMLKTARTIADLDNSSEVDERHISEAFQYRVKLG